MGNPTNDILVYGYKSGKGYKHTFTRTKKSFVAGKFVGVQHPDTLPDGEYHYQPATLWDQKLYQPSYNWILFNTPKQ